MPADFFNPDVHPSGRQLEADRLFFGNLWPAAALFNPYPLMVAQAPTAIRAIATFADTADDLLMDDRPCHDLIVGALSLLTEHLSRTCGADSGAYRCCRRALLQLCQGDPGFARFITAYVRRAFTALEAGTYAPLIHTRA